MLDRNRRLNEALGRGQDEAKQLVVRLREARDLCHAMSVSKTDFIGEHSISRRFADVVGCAGFLCHELRCVLDSACSLQLSRVRLSL